MVKCIAKNFGNQLGSINCGYPKTVYYPVWVVGLVVAIVSESCIDPALVFLGHSRRWVDQGDVLVLLKMRCGLQQNYFFSLFIAFEPAPKLVRSPSLGFGKTNSCLIRDRRKR